MPIATPHTLIYRHGRRFKLAVTATTMLVSASVVHWGFPTCTLVTSISSFCPICVVFCFQARFKSLSMDHSRLR